jgi:hypothetical protein
MEENKINSISVKEKISLLWVVVMMNMIFADIYGMMFTDAMGAVPVVPQVLILIFALINEIPIIMIFLSRVLNGKANKIANIAAGVLTILFVVAGGSLTAIYIFFATIEVIAMLYIIRLAWQSEGL